MATTVTDQSAPGACPDCETPLHSTDVLIEYERGNGQPAAWADCPRCRDIVRPIE
jgi:hypothetical protein